MTTQSATAAEGSAAPPSDRFFLLVVVSLFSFLNPFMASALHVAIPALGRELGVPATTLSWVVAAYLVASAALLLPAGRAGDVFGRLLVFWVGVVAYGVFSLGCALAPSPAALIVFRSLQGAGAALSFANGVAILVSAFPPSKRGRVLGITIAAVYAGLSAGPVLGGLITEWLGWRAIFFINAGASLMVAMMLARVSWSVDERGGGAFSFRLGALYVASMAALMASATGLRSQDWAPWVLAVGAAGLTLFLMRQPHISQPMLELGMFRHLGFSFGNLAALINYSSTFAVVFLLSLYLQLVRGLDAGAAGMVLLAQPLVMTVLSPMAGRLSDRVEPRLVASAGLVLTSAGLALCAGLHQHSAIGLVVVAQAVIGAGFGFFSSPNTHAVMSTAHPAQFGVASAVLATMRLVGQALSMALVTILLAGTLGDAQLGPETAPKVLTVIRQAFALFAVLNLAAMAASLARGRSR